MKAVPGRKTDVKDAEWIADLLQHGLLQPSYIPNKDQRELRELVRYRKGLIGERTRELNRLQKMLEGANIKLSGTVSDINGKSARSILEYLLTGASIGEAKYDEMYQQKIIAHNLKATKEQIIDDLNGVMSPLQRRMMKGLLAHLDPVAHRLLLLFPDRSPFLLLSDISESGSMWYCHLLVRIWINLSWFTLSKNCSMSISITHS